MRVRPMEILILGALLGSTGAACSRSATEVPIRGMILISVDTLRADHLGFYGYDRPTTPSLDALAQEGVVFDDASSTANGTLPAHASLLSGLYPNSHGLRRETSRARPLATLASILSRQGYWTGAVVNSFFLTQHYGLDRGFAEFVYIEEIWSRTGPSTWVTDRALRWLGAARAEPFFLFLHYYDPHSDYRANPAYLEEFVEPFDGLADGTTEQLLAVRRGDLAFDKRDAAHLIDLYDASIRQTDDELARLFRFLREANLMDNVLLIFTSDHGEEFLDHGGVLHGHTLYQELIRVPLLIRGPGIPRGRRVSAPVSLVDVVPTALAILGVPTPCAVEGIDLTPLWQARAPEVEERILFSQSEHRGDDLEFTVAARLQQHKLQYDARTGEIILYDLEHDPRESHDIASERPDLVARLLVHLKRYRRERLRDTATRPLSSDVAEKLRKLGYLQ